MTSKPSGSVRSQFERDYWHSTHDNNGKPIKKIRKKESALWGVRWALDLVIKKAESGECREESLFAKEISKISKEFL